MLSVLNVLDVHCVPNVPNVVKDASLTCQAFFRKIVKIDSSMTWVKHDFMKEKEEEEDE